MNQALKKTPYNLLSELYAQENNLANRKISLLVSIIIHGVLLVLFYFFFKYAPPNPPLPDYGVELNFGVDEEGFGNLQTLAPANENPLDAAPGTPKPEVPTPKPDQAETPVAPALVEDEINTTQEESPVEVPIEKINKPVKKAEPEKPLEKPAKPQKDNKPEPVAPAPQAENGGLGRAGSSSATAGNNNGDRPGKVGDQGSKEGTLDSRNLYGTPGGGNGSGNGASLDMAGWVWDKRPDQTDASAEEGKIVFQIQVDGDGTLISVRVLEKTVSPKVVQFYQNQIENLEFSKTADNKSTAAISAGRITIVIKSR